MNARMVPVDQVPSGQPIVFAGPSTSGLDVSKWPDLIFAPPAEAGDVLRAVRRGVTAIGLIDGFFETTRAVWHKEILWAIEEGVPVLGASSMGALRAAELRPFGMSGVGKIFELYRDGVLTDDDEVALQHGPAETDYLLLTHAMINIREAIEASARDCVITEQDATTIVRTAKAIFYKTRTADMICAHLPDGFSAPTHPIENWEVWLTATLSDPRHDLKRRDATRLLDRLSSGVDLADLSPVQPSRELFPRTDQILNLARETGALS